MLPQSSCLQAGFVLAHSLFLARMLPGACCFAQHDAMDHVCAFGAIKLDCCLSSLFAHDEITWHRCPTQKRTQL